MSSELLKAETQARHYFPARSATKFLQGLLP
jgi:hypothetical protein